MQTKNAVVKRIDMLTKVWQQFTENSDARVLRLQLTSDAGRMIDAFLAYHLEQESDLQDLFLPIVVPCVNADSYWNNVRQEIIAQNNDAQSDLESLDIPADWQPPVMNSQATAAESCIEVLTNFQHHYHEFFDHVSVVLLPKEVQSQNAWLHCLDQLMQTSSWAKEVRVLLVDWKPNQFLNDWAANNAARVQSVSPKLDMPGLPLELLAHLPGSGAGFDFRRLFVQLTSAAGCGNFALVPALAQQALAIATRQNWHALAATVQLILGGAMAAMGQDDKVLQAYRDARQLASKIQDPTGPKMAVTSAMAEAGALLSGGKFREARQVYLEAAREADRGVESLSSMDARRMASYCAECNGDVDQAWQDAQSAVQAARKLEPNARQNSTLPALLHRMQELARRPEMAVRNINIERECAELLGNQWTGILHQTRTLLS
jgi:hypothetical protein